MKQLLRIGYSWFCLPEGVNLNRLLKELGDARHCESRYSHGNDYFTLKDKVPIELKVVDEKFVVDPAKRKRIPEQTGGPY